MTRRAVPIVVAAALCSCSSDGQDSLPEACRSDAASVRAALADAPDRVELGGVPLSRCLVKSSEPSDVQEVGTVFLEAAVELGRAAAASPEGDSALRLGYLIGAARRGSQRTQGIHSELVRRLEQEAGAIAGRSEAFRRGERAGARLG